MQGLMSQYGWLGVILAMLLESSIVPIPSEAVVVAAGYVGIPLWTIVWAGAIGSTLGGCIGYAIGRSGVRWFLDRFGRWIGLTTARLQTLDELATRYGIFSVLIGRLVPFVPFKVFSIGAGMSRVAFGGFVLMTFVGVVPRLFLLALAGSWLRRAALPTLGVLMLLGVLLYLRKRLKARRNRTASPIVGDGSI